MRQDLKHFHINESVWFVVAQDRDQWSQLCAPTPSLSVPDYQCSRNCFVGSVIDFSGDLRIWLDTGVTVSDLDGQQGAVIV